MEVVAEKKKKPDQVLRESRKHYKRGGDEEGSKKPSLYPD